MNYYAPRGQMGKLSLTMIVDDSWWSWEREFQLSLTIMDYHIMDYHAPFDQGFARA